MTSVGTIAGETTIELVIAFRHLVYHLTTTREYPEPEVEDHHHAYSMPEFLTALDAAAFATTDSRFEHPFSYYAARVTAPVVVKLARLMDEKLGDEQIGFEFFCTAYKQATEQNPHHDSAAQRQHIGQITNAVEFLAWFKAVTQIIARELDPESDKANEHP